MILLSWQKYCFIWEFKFKKLKTFKHHVNFNESSQYFAFLPAMSEAAFNIFATAVVLLLPTVCNTCNEIKFITENKSKRFTWNRYVFESRAIKEIIAVLLCVHLCMCEKKIKNKNNQKALDEEIGSRLFSFSSAAALSFLLFFDEPWTVSACTWNFVLKKDLNSIK